MYEEQTLAERIDRLERKIDRLFRDLFRFLSEYVASDDQLKMSLIELKEETATVREEASLATTQQFRANQGSAGVKVFSIDIDEHGKFRFDPPQWDYRIGNKLQWVSRAGKFKIQVNEDYRELGVNSPFNGLDKIDSRRDENDKLWKTEPIPVTSVFSEAERLARRLTGTPEAYFKYVVAMDRDGEIFIDTSRNGGGC